MQDGQNNPNHNFKSERPLTCFRFIIPRGDGGIDDVHISLSKFLTMSTECDLKNFKMKLIITQWKKLL